MVEIALPVIDPHLALVIDDDAQIRQLIEATLAQLGMTVDTFQMAKEALASIDISHPAVIFLDVALLRSDAIDVLRGLGQRQYGGVVQLMSGGRPALLEAVARIGVRHGVTLAAPLSKPVTPSAVVRVIESLRSSGAPAPAASGAPA